MLLQEKMCSSRRSPSTPFTDGIGISWEWGDFQRLKNFKKHEAYPEFQTGWGFCKKIVLHGGGIDILWNLPKNTLFPGSLILDPGNKVDPNKMLVPNHYTAYL